MLKGHVEKKTVFNKFNKFYPKCKIAKNFIYISCNLINL